MAERKVIKTKVAPDHLRFRAAGVLIIANVFTFCLIHLLPLDKEALYSLLLSVDNLKKGHVLSLVWSGFIHRDIYHLGFNMLGIFIFASILEKHFGFLKTLTIYFGSLIFSMVLSLLIYTFLLKKNIIIIGASGALMGLIACAMLIDPFRITYEMILPIPVMFKAWFFLYADIHGFLAGEKDGVSHLAHLCGFLSVAFVVYALNKNERILMRKGLLANIVTFIIFLLLNQWIALKTGKPILPFLPYIQ